jgi:pSer/pThr/pTyr-binding forkhead associated (FHA) protein
MLPGATMPLPANSVASLKDAPALIVIAHGIPQVVHLKRRKRVTLGRDKTCDIVLAEVAASRRHAEVVSSQDGFYIRDLGSANGVMVNQMKIDNPYLLAHEDSITIGSIVIYFMQVRQDDYASAVRNAGQIYICHNCGAPNTSKARFCPNCGAPLET